MRVLYIVTGTAFGGASVHVLALAEHMVRLGHTVAVLSYPEQILAKRCRQIGVKFFENPHFVQSIQINSDILSPIPVLRTLRKFKPDLVSTHSTKAGAVGRMCCALRGIDPVLFTAHGWGFAENQGALGRRVVFGAERFAAHYTKQIICVSEHGRRTALDFTVAPPHKVVVVRNGIDPSPFETTTGERIRAEFSIPTDSVLLTMIGRMSPPKDHATLLKSVENLNGDFTVLLVGGGPNQRQLRQLIESGNLHGRVILTGERTDIPEILGATDVFILSSGWEGLPRSIIEAMMSRLPVIATDVGGVSELVVDGQTGHLVQARDHVTLSTRLQDLIDNREARKRMGERGHKRALTHFTLERMLQETLAVYRKTVAHT